MAGIWQMAGALKWIALAVIFVNVIVGLIGATSASFKQHSSRPLLDWTGNTVLAADDQIYRSTVFLENEALIQSNPDVYTSEYLDYHRKVLTEKLFTLGILIFLAFKGAYTLLGGAQKDNVMKPIFAFMFAILFIGILEFAFVLATTQTLIIPFRGLWELITHFGVFTATSGSGAVLVNTSGLVNASA